MRNAAKVDVSNVLDSIDKELIRTGAWLNVIGYVTGSGIDSACPSPDGQFRQGQLDHGGYLNTNSCQQTQPSQLQAVTIWHVGQIKRAASESRYSQSLQARRKSMNVLESARRIDAVSKEW